MRIIIKESGIEYPMADAPTIRTPEDAHNQVRGAIDDAQEVFVVMMLNRQNALISADVVNVGCLSACLCDARSIFRTAIIKNAAAVILIHNHPSGDPTPSAEDLKMTRTLISAGKILEIRVQDHIILGTGAKFFSLRESSMIDFS